MPGAADPAGALVPWLLEPLRSLGLEVDVDIVLDVGTETPTSIRAALRVRDVGARNGMLVFHDFSHIRFHSDALVDMGYGFSCLEAPLGGGVLSACETRSLLLDWGWTGHEARRPEWFGERDR